MSNDAKRRNILQDALNYRTQEIMMHQINIDNYTNAIEIIANEYSENKELKEFGKQIAELLRTSNIEYMKEIVMHQAISKQLLGSH